MVPASATVLLLIGFFGAFVVIMKLPAVILGFLLATAFARFQWIVEFLYPTPVGRWLHISLMRLVERSKKLNPNGANRGCHSRTIETRIEVVKGRVFIHPLPQLLDNLGYLVVSCPQNVPRIFSRKKEERAVPIVAFVVDCGDANAVVRQLKLISQAHYQGRKIQVQSILSTHKHHDHTAGNKGLLAQMKSIKHVVGGAVEKVPFCNFLVADGEMLPLPKHESNDMNALVEVEVIATPAHTRGSLTYALRPVNQNVSSGLAFLFTGDTMFCGGGGVPFEADIDKNQEKNNSKMTPYSFINAAAFNHAVERSFAEVLARSSKSNDQLLISSSETTDRLFVFPGHEYTADLLKRQITEGGSQTYKWKSFPPSAFFETASEMYTSMHHRSLPRSSGTLLNIPSSVTKELLINPHFRSLKKRGEIVVQAIKQWHKHFAKNKSTTPDEVGNYASAGKQQWPRKSHSTETSWTLDAANINARVFRTVYASDLDSIISDLKSEAIDSDETIQRLEEMKTKLDHPVIGRRPLPGTLPSDRSVYKGLLGMVLLGSRPCGLTLSDARIMKLPPPVVSRSDQIQISRTRLVSVLRRLGLLSEENDGTRVASMIEQLWKEANEYRASVNSVMDPSLNTKENSNGIPDVENSTTSDKIDLGSLKWIMYGFPPHPNPTSRFAKFCRPCSTQKVEEKLDHPAHKANMKQSSAELVRHDVHSCLLCRSATGCIETRNAAAPPEEIPMEKIRTELTQADGEEQSSANTETANTDGEDPSIEITPAMFF